MRRRSERGAIIIMVAVALFGLMLFSAFVLDYGIMWASRAQIQTAADAAALSGALTLSFDAGTATEVKQKARAAGLSNAVWNAPPEILTTDVTIIPCPITPTFPAGDTCVKADAYRNQTRGNPLPTIFGQLAGLTAQGVVATATARPVGANAANCLKPWVVGDKWLDTQPGGWSQTATYDYAAGDRYVPPTPANYPTPGTPANAGTGFSAKDASGNPIDYGYQMVLKLANPGQGSNQIPVESAGWAMEVCLNDDAGNNPCNNNAYGNAIEGCTTDHVAIAAPGSTCTAVDPTLGCLGVKTGSGGSTNATAVGNFIADHDPQATWVNGSGASPWQTGHIVTSESPSSRIVPIALFDVPQYLGGGYTGGNGIVRIVNIVGFFLEGTCLTSGVAHEAYLQCPGGGNAKSAIIGRLVNYQGIRLGTGPVIGNFGTILTLVR